jgi:DNA-binding HxlR family transcriptional regulator
METLKKRLFSCGLEASLSVIGGRWKFLIIWQLASQPRRFGELRRLVAGVTEKMLIQGLKELEKDGVVSRKDFREVPPKVEYSLTERGVELANVLRPLCEWGTENFKGQIAPAQFAGQKIKVTGTLNKATKAIRQTTVGGKTAATKLAATTSSSS